MISHKITKHSKPFSDAEFIKDCFVVSAKIGIKKEVANENVTISRQTLRRWIEDIAGNLKSTVGVQSLFICSTKASWSLLKNS